MPKYFENISKFYGNGEPNEDGLTLDEYLEQYDPYRYKTPSVTADIIVMRQVQKGFQLLMVKRRNHPCIGEWALPGGFAEMEEDLDESAKRELEEETGLSGIPVQQMHTWGDVERDPRGRTISVSYLAVLEEEKQVIAGDDAKDAAWVDVMCELVESNMEQQWEKNLYKLCLVNKEKDVNGCALVEVSQRKDSILRQTKYQIIENKGIAFDHAKMIVQAMKYLN